MARKLFVAVCSLHRHRHHALFFVRTSLITYLQLSALALRLAPQDPSRLPNWIVATSTELLSAGAATEHILDFLENAVEEVNGADPCRKEVRACFEI